MMHKNKTRYLLSGAASLLCLLPGCKIAPEYETPLIELPNSWHTDTPSFINEEAIDSVVWWENLNDPLLSELINLAASQNLDLQIAASRVMQSRMQLKGKQAALLPHVDFTASYDHIYCSKEALVDGLLYNAKKKSHIKRNFNAYEAGFDVEWELDFFGRLKHEAKAAAADGEAVRENLCAVWVSLSAEIAKNYVELRGYQHHREAAKRKIEMQKAAIVLNEELLGRGITSEANDSNLKAEWEILQSRISQLEFFITKAIHKISILLGYCPGELYDKLSVAAALPMLPQELSIGIPSELLRRRPDICKAERELAAATERTSSAIASLFPRLSLRGFFGDVSTRSAGLFNGSSTTWFAGPQLLLPIFNSRAIQQDIDYSRTETHKALINYQKTVLEALEEAENAISAFKFEEDRLQHLSEAYQHHKKALRLTSELYLKGINDLFAINNAEKQLLSTEEIVIQSQVDLIVSYITLYRALGGSWGSGNCET